jgi:hypothetical protein
MQKLGYEPQKSLQLNWKKIKVSLHVQLNILGDHAKNINRYAICLRNKGQDKKKLDYNLQLCTQ